MAVSFANNLTFNGKSRVIITPSGTGTGNWTTFGASSVSTPISLAGFRPVQNAVTQNDDEAAYAVFRINATGNAGLVHFNVPLTGPTSVAATPGGVERFGNFTNFPDGACLINVDQSLDTVIGAGRNGSTFNMRRYITSNVNDVVTDLGSSVSDTTVTMDGVGISNNKALLAICRATGTPDVLNFSSTPTPGTINLGTRIPLTGFDGDVKVAFGSTTYCYVVGQDTSDDCVVGLLDVSGTNPSLEDTATVTATTANTDYQISAVNTDTRALFGYVDNGTAVRLGIATRTGATVAANTPTTIATATTSATIRVIVQVANDTALVGYSIDGEGFLRPYSTAGGTLSALAPAYSLGADIIPTAAVRVRTNAVFLIADDTANSQGVHYRILV